MLYSDIIAVCCEIHIKHKPTLWSSSWIVRRVRKQQKKKMEQLVSHQKDVHEI